MSLKAKLMRFYEYIFECFIKFEVWLFNICKLFYNKYVIIFLKIIFIKLRNINLLRILKEICKKVCDVLGSKYGKE